MQYSIVITVEASGSDVLDDIVHTLETVLPYMADNVVVTSGEPFDSFEDLGRLVRQLIPSADFQPNHLDQWVINTELEVQ